MKRKNTKTSNSAVREQPTQLTFREHVRELQGRLFATLFIFLIISAGVFPFFNQIVGVIVAPLGKQHELVYLTPGGAFTFMMQVCMYIGLIGTLPAIIYHLYRFIMPAVQKVKMRKVILYTVSSLILALVGIAFAYKFSLPSAIQFLIGFNLAHINPMLTIDSYLSFVMTYLLAGALLFQLPLVMLIIDSVRPQKPSQLMKHQGKILLGSYIAAAIITPTPDVINQTLIACPIVVMYQVGIMLIAFRHRKRQKEPKATLVVQPSPSTVGYGGDIHRVPVFVAPVFSPPPAPVSVVRTMQTPSYTIDGFRRGVVKPAPRPPTARPVVTSRPITSSVNRRSIDGVLRCQPRPIAFGG